MRIRHLTPRKMIVVLAVLFVMVSAGLLNSGFAGMRGLRYVAFLGQWEIFHVVAHIIIFAGLVIGVWAIQPDVLSKAWIAVLGVTLLIEGVQIVTIKHPFNAALIKASLYDVGVNLLGAAVGWLMVRLIERRQQKHDK